MVGEEAPERDPVHFSLQTELFQGPQFTCEEQPAIMFAPMERFHPETVAGDEKPIGLRIVYRQGEESVEIMQECRTFHDEEPQDEFRVRT